jgi:hypothetical protein
LVLISASTRSEIKSQGLFILGYRSRHAATREIKAKHTSEEKKRLHEVARVLSPMVGQN